MEKINLAELFTGSCKVKFVSIFHHARCSVANNAHVFLRCTMLGTSVKVAGIVVVVVVVALALQVWTKLHF